MMRSLYSSPSIRETSTYSYVLQTKLIIPECLPNASNMFHYQGNACFQRFRSVRCLKHLTPFHIFVHKQDHNKACTEYHNQQNKLLCKNDMCSGPPVNISSSWMTHTYEIVMIYYKSNWKFMIIDTAIFKIIDIEMSKCMHVIKRGLFRYCNDNMIIINLDKARKYWLPLITQDRFIICCSTIWAYHWTSICIYGVAAYKLS